MAKQHKCHSCKKQRKFMIKATVRVSSDNVNSMDMDTYWVCLQHFIKTFEFDTDTTCPAPKDSKE